jgi:hypothetical protein
MTVLLYVAGLVVGLACFMYFLHLYETGKEKVRTATGRKPAQAPAKENLSPNMVSFAAMAPGERMCPLCRTKLSKYEALYASRMRFSDGDKIMIHGCRYCYKPDEDPDRVKKSLY